MSADNGIYILETKDGFRVCHAQAIDNLTWRPNYHNFNKQELIEYFGDCKVLKTKEEALQVAAKIEENLYICEYGIQFIRGLENEYFPTPHES